MEIGVIGAMLRDSPSTFLVRHQLDSFDDFISNKIKSIIELQPTGHPLQLVGERQRLRSQVQSRDI
jgi:hypothetical protein